MARTNNASRKIQKVTLVITAVIVAIALLFILRAYISEKFGIFASTENNEGIAFSVNLADVELNPNLSSNVIKNSAGRVVLEDTAKPGWIKSQIVNTNLEKLTSVRVNAIMPSGCAASNAKLSVQSCTSSADQLTCGDWLQSDSATPYLVRFPIAITPNSFWYRVDLTPCTASLKTVTATVSSTATSTPLEVGINGTQTYGVDGVQLENNNITVKQGGVLILAGKHTFNNLIVESGGTVTQAALATGDFDESTGVLTQTGQNKKVDLVITNETKILGEINVSGKGYPAYDSTKIPVDCVSQTDTTKCKKGYGPGGGGSNYGTNNVAVYAAGAGHGGKGAAGRYNSQIIQYVPGGIAYDSNITPVLPGSAGGSARAHNVTDQSSDGGGGGGVVKLTTGILTVEGQGAIKANGIAAVCKTGSCGGGGSGGSILIEITKEEAQTTVLTANVNAGAVPVVAANIAEVGTVYKSGIDVGFGPILQAKGGGVEINGATSRVAPGAGGRISIVSDQLAEPTSPELNSIDVFKYIAKVTSTISEPPVPPLPSLTASSTASSPPVPPLPSITTSTTATVTKTATVVAYLTVTPITTVTASPTVLSAGEFLVSGIKSGVSFALIVIIVVLVGGVIIFKIMTAKD